MCLVPINLIWPMMLVLMAPLAAMAEDHDEHLTIDDLPSPVKAAVLKLANGHRVGEIEKEAERGKTIYKVKIGENEILLHANGRVLSMKTSRAEHGEKEEKAEEGKEEKEKEKEKKHDEKDEQEKEGKERH